MNQQKVNQAKKRFIQELTNISNECLSVFPVDISIAMRNDDWSAIDNKMTKIKFRLRETEEILMALKDIRKE